MLADELRRQIESWCAQLRERSRLLSLTRRGGLSRSALALYLRSLGFLFHHSQRHLRLAGERCLAAGRLALGECLLRKAREEVGHDAWAADDLAALGAGGEDGLRPARGVVALVELQGRLIERDPLLFLAYALWAEYFTVVLGDDWVAALEASGYAPEQVTALTKHIEADRLHSAQALATLDGFVDEHTDVQAVLGAVEEAERLFEAFCEEIHDTALEAEASGALAS